MNATAPVVCEPQQHIQALQALERANKVRLARADLKRQVMEGELSAADVIMTRPWEAETMSVGELLMSQHRWGLARARRFLATIPMTETKTIGSMTDRQRTRLAKGLLAQTRSVRSPPRASV